MQKDISVNGRKNSFIFCAIAGGASTNHHILSSESRKYFQRAILLSGAIDNHSALSEEKHHLKRAHQIAKELGEPKNSVEDLVEFLKNVSANELSQFSTIQVASNTLFMVAFGPIIESAFLIFNFHSVGALNSLRNLTLFFYRKRC